MKDERTLDPNVILDVAFEDGLLFFELSNRGSVPARKVVTAFRKPILAPDGTTDITGLNVFKKTEFLAPNKTIRVFVDSVVSYFARRQPNLIYVAITWREGKRAMTTQISHDVRIYKDLPYVTGRGADARRGESAVHRIDLPGR